MKEKEGRGHFRVYHEKNGQLYFQKVTLDSIFDKKKTWKNCNARENNQTEYLVNAIYIISEGCVFIKGTSVRTSEYSNSWHNATKDSYKIAHAKEFCYLPDDALYTSVERPTTTYGSEKWWKKKESVEYLQGGCYLLKKEFSQEYKTSMFTIDDC